MSHQAGFTNTVATSGTALTGEHLSLLKRLSDKIVMAYDGDEAGLSAANKGAKLALGMGMEVKLVEISDYQRFQQALLPFPYPVPVLPPCSPPTNRLRLHHKPSQSCPTIFSKEIDALPLRLCQKSQPYW